MVPGPSPRGCAMVRPGLGSTEAGVAACGWVGSGVAGGLESQSEKTSISCQGKSPEVARQKQGGKMRLLEGKTAQVSPQWSPSPACLFCSVFACFETCQPGLTDLLSADFRFPPGFTSEFSCRCLLFLISTTFLLSPLLEITSVK